MKECKANFKSYYKDFQEIYSTLSTEQKIDNQQHAFGHKVLSKNFETEELVKKNISYTDIFKNTDKQKDATVLIHATFADKKKIQVKKVPQTSCRI